jgi:hypothetical protein
LSLPRPDVSARPRQEYSSRRPAALRRGEQHEPTATDYQRLGWFTKHVFNPIVAGLTRVGVSLAGSRVLEVRGRKSGEWRRTPVNPLEFEGARYIVAPRGERSGYTQPTGEWQVALAKGRRTEEFTATELPDEESDTRRPSLVPRSSATGFAFSSIPYGVLVRADVESTARQYALRERAVELGWASKSVVVIDEDLGRSGASSDGRFGFRNSSPRSGSGTSD